MLGNRSRKTRLFFITIGLALACSGREALYADPLDDWHVRNSSVSTSDLYARNVRQRHMGGGGEQRRSDNL